VAQLKTSVLALEDQISEQKVWGIARSAPVIASVLWLGIIRWASTDSNTKPICFGTTFIKYHCVVVFKMTCWFFGLDQDGATSFGGRAR